MMKKTFLWVLMSIMALPTMLFTSCDDSEDDNLTQEQRETKELRDKLMKGCTIDLSDAVCGRSALGIWNLRDDSTFTYYYVTNLEGEDADHLTYDLDSVAGKWHAFANVDNIWDENDVKLSGFNASFDWGKDLGIDTEDDVQTFYLICQEDSIAITLVDSSIDYIFNYARSGLDTKFSWSDIGDFFIQTIPSAVCTAVDELVNGVKYINQSISNFFSALFGDNTCENLNEAECKQYWEYARRAVEELQSIANAIDYSDWMSEIYAGKESTTRICDMNIPGTHDTFTYNFLTVGAFEFIENRAVTQLKSVEDQWNLGIRCFDVRLRTTYKNLTVDDEHLRETDGILGIFHGLFYCGMTADTAINKLINLLKAHPKETAIAMCSIEGDQTEAIYKYASELFNDSKFKDYVIWNPKPGMTLADCQGKLIVFQNWDENNNYPQYRIGASIDGCFNKFRKDCKMRFYDSNGNVEIANCFNQNLCQPAEILDLCSTFWNQKRAAMRECFEEVAASKGSGENVWGINQESAYVGGLGVNMSYSKCSNHMNPATFYLVYNGEARKNKMGIIVLDYVGTNELFNDYYVNGEALSKLVVETNRYQ